MDEALLETLLASFLPESKDLAARITRSLLEVEKAPAGGEALEATYASLARALHTLKGSAGSVGLGELSELAHQLEEALSPFKRAGTVMPPPLVDAFLGALDAGMNWLFARAAKRPLPDLEGARLQILQAAGAPEATPSVDPPDGPAAAAGPTTPASGPHGAATEPDEAQDGWRVEVGTVTGLLGEVERLREVALRLEERVRDLGAAAHELARPALRPHTGQVREGLATVRRTLANDAAEADALVDAMEERIKAICTLPFQTVVDPLHRTVRDLCRQHGKEARISAVGVEIALDRRVLEALRPCLVQLVRNAIDHGIETPAVREAAGKHREAILSIRVEQAGNLVFVEFADDGAGIDAVRIQQAAVRRGVLTAAEAQALGEQELQALIFRPGFTTREQATETSGRGVGLDIVAAAVHQLQGQVEVHSKPGQGTRFVLSLPAELGSSQLMVVRVGEHVVGVPTHAVRKALPADPSEFVSGRSQLQLRWGRSLIPLMDLGGRLGIRQPLAPSAGQPVLVVDADGREVALAVDEVVGDRNPVVRPLPVEVRGLSAYLGAALLARGEPVLVLRPAWLVSAEVPAGRSVARQVLVVDDSLTARAVHRAVLESAGYAVHGASTAQQALEQLQRARYDALVCDIDLGGEMDGVTLTAQLRAMPALRDLPVVLVSGHDDDTQKSRGREAGADSFVSKKECAAGKLLGTLSEAVARRRARA